MQSLKRTISCDGGFKVFDNVTILNMTDSVIKRGIKFFCRIQKYSFLYLALIGDGNARKIPLRIERSSKDLSGQNTNDSSLIAYRWTNSMGRNMRISEFRFKNPAIQMGKFFNL